MGQNNLTFCSMFANSLFNRQKNMFVFIFISQIIYKQMEFTVLNREQKFIYNSFVSTLASYKRPPPSLGKGMILINAWAFIRAFTVCVIPVLCLEWKKVIFSMLNILHRRKCQKLKKCIFCGYG